MNSASFFVIFFCSLFLLFDGLDRAQNTKGIHMKIKLTSKNISAHT